MLRLLWFQLDLFQSEPLHAEVQAMEDSERDRRSGPQWLKAVRSYLQFQSGDSWRRLSDPLQRNSPERIWYLNGIRRLNSLGAGHCAALPTRLLEKKTDDLRAAKFALLPRVELVDRLLRADASLSNRRLLMHLSRRKLATMLIAASDRAAAERAA